MLDGIVPVTAMRGFGLGKVRDQWPEQDTGTAMSRRGLLGRRADMNPSSRMGLKCRRLLRRTIPVHIDPVVLGMVFERLVHGMDMRCPTASKVALGPAHRIIREEEHRPLADISMLF